MKKINRSNANAAPTAVAAPPVAPQPAPQPAPQVVTATVVATPAAPAYVVAAPAAAPALPAVPFANSGLGAYTRTEETPIQTAGSPHVQFYEQRAGNAAKLLQAFGPLQTGTPIVVRGEDAVKLGSAGLIVLEELRHWVQLDSADFKPTATSLTAKPGFKENILTLLLVVPDRDGKIDDNLAPATATVTTFRGPKGTFVKQFLGAVDAASRPEWARQSDYHAKLIEAGVPPRFRVVGTPVLKGRTASSGFAYVECGAQVSPVSPMQVEKLSTWWASEECQADLADAKATYDRLAALIREQAAETAGK